MTLAYSETIGRLDVPAGRRQALIEVVLFVIPAAVLVAVPARAQSAFALTLGTLVLAAVVFWARRSAYTLSVDGSEVRASYAMLGAATGPVIFEEKRISLDRIERVEVLGGSVGRFGRPIVGSPLDRFLYHVPGLVVKTPDATYYIPTREPSQCMNAIQQIARPR